MNDQFIHNELDNAFKMGIESMKLDPASKTWGKIEAGISKMENVVMRKKIRSLKIVSSALGTLLISLGSFIVFHYSTDHKVTVGPPANKEIASASNGSEKNSTSTDPHVEKAPLIKSAPDTKSPAIPATENNNKVVPEKNSGLSSKEGSLQHKNKSSTGNSADQPKENTAQKQESADLSEKKNGISENAAIEKNDPSVLNDSKVSEPTAVLSLRTDAPAILSSSTDTSGKTTVQITDSSKAPGSGDDFGGALPSPVRVFVSAFFSPELTSEVFRDNNTNDQITNSDVRGEQDRKFSFSTGIKCGLDLNNHWSIRSGLVFSKYAHDLKPELVISEDLNGNNQNSYTLITGAGAIQLPAAGHGDSLSLRKNSYQTLSYLDLPFQFKYSLKIKHFSFYAFSGISAKILLDQTTFLSTVTNDEGESEQVINDLKGINKAGLGYSVGIGFSYSIWRRFYLNAEPEFKGTITPINNNSPIKTYPFGFGLSTGITYHF